MKNSAGIDKKKCECRCHCSLKDCGFKHAEACLSCSGPTRGVDGMERTAMNIVYQIGDLLEANVDKRQATNDKAIDFTMKLISALFKPQQDLVIGKIKTTMEKYRNVCDCSPKNLRDLGCKCGAYDYNLAQDDLLKSLTGEGEKVKE